MNSKELSVVYGMYDLCPEREQARWSLGYILQDFEDIKQRYITLGFHLDEFKRYEYYKDFGYLTFHDFCEKNLPLDKGAISRCLSVFELFAAVDKSTGYASRKMWIDEKYKDFSYTQLSEMVSMSTPIRDLVTSDMSVSKIREVKKYCKDNAIKPYDDCAVHDVRCFIERGCIPSAVVKVASTQPEAEPEQRVREKLPLFSCCEFHPHPIDSEEFIEIMFKSIIERLKILSLDFCDFEYKGKQLTFKDENGDNYKLLYMVSKKKGV